MLFQLFSNTSQVIKMTYISPKNCESIPGIINMIAIINQHLLEINS